MGTTAKETLSKRLKNLSQNRLLPLLVLLSIWFIFAHPYFLQSNVPYPSSHQVNTFHPWREYKQFWGPVKNDAMPDIVEQIMPWKKLVVDSWKQGEIPLWNPYSFSGTPLLANYQSAALSPFLLLFFILPFIDAWSIIVLLQPLLAGLFTYLFVRSLKVSTLGSLLSAIAFMFSGFIVVWMAYGTLALAIVFLPLILWSIQRLYIRLHPGLLLVTSLGLFVSFTAGHFQTSLYLFLFVFCFLIYQYMTTRNKKTTVLVLLALFFGLLLAMPQLLPTIELYTLSPRSTAIQTSGGIPFFYLPTLVAPDFFGNPVTRNNTFGYYAEWASFVGMIPFVLAVFAVTTRRRIVLFFSMLSFATLLLAVESPIHTLLPHLKIPVLSTSIPSRIIVLFSFSLAVLAGFGLDTIRTFFLQKKKKHMLFKLIVVWIVFLVVWFLLLRNLFPLADLDIAVAKKNLLLPTALLGITTIGIVFLLFYPKKQLIGLFAILLLLLTAFDSLRFVQKWMPFDTRAFVFPTVPVIEKIQEKNDHGRIAGNIRGVLTYYHVPLIEGYDPLYNKQYGEFVRSADTGTYLEAERSVVSVAAHAAYIDRLYDILGVSLFFHPNKDTKQSWAYPIWDKEEKYKKVFSDARYTLYENNTRLDRAQLFYTYAVIHDEKKLLEAFYSPTFPFRETVLLREDPGIPNQQEGEGTVKIRSYKPNEIVLDVKTSHPALVFLSDVYYPGWHASSKNKEIPIYKANYTFRAIPVSAGEQNIVLTYTPFAFYLGLVLVGIGMGGLTTMSILLWKRKEKS